MKEHSGKIGRIVEVAAPHHSCSQSRAPQRKMNDSRSSKRLGKKRTMMASDGKEKKKTHKHTFQSDNWGDIDGGGFKEWRQRWMTILDITIILDFGR